MRGFRKDAFAAMNLQMPGMELASEMVIKSRLAGLTIDEIPITLLSRRSRSPAAFAKLPRRLAAPALHADVQPDVPVRRCRACC